MKKWENLVNKAASSDEIRNCQCNQQYGLFLPNRQLSGVIAALLFLFFALFMTGYFVGKRYAAEQFMHIANQEACADAQYNGTIMEENSQRDSNNAMADFSDEGQGIVSAVVGEDIKPANMLAEGNDAAIEWASGQAAPRYYAQLIGFGTEKAAERFVQKLALKNIETNIKKHTSKTAKGRIACWYQVVTAPYYNKDDLSRLVDQISKEERLKDVIIRAY